MPTAVSEPTDDLTGPAKQDIRVAVVLNGGVSLAVWISGVTQELYRLVQASRLEDPQDRARDPYAGLLDVLDATARIDVVAGTSAGGLNGGFLSAGLVHGCTLDTLRDLWVGRGALRHLLRDPLEKNPPSLLRGDYFHDELVRAYRDVLSGHRRAPAPDGETVDLYLTGTLWEGRQTSFVDDMGRRIVETDYDATFHFTSDPEIVGAASATRLAGDLRATAEVADQLAAASRCTSSFPAAFEPFPVTIDADNRVGDRWTSTAGRANFHRSQYVVDGGVLRNKPVRPAIDAIYRQAAGRQVRRVLAYVVPDPGEQPSEVDSTRATGMPPVPGATDVLLSAVSRLRSTDSVADELHEITRRNEDTRHRRRTRDRLAAMLLAASTAGAPATTPAGGDPADGSTASGHGESRPGADLAAAAYPAYREVRKERAARAVARSLLAGPGTTNWSRREISTVLRTLADDEAMPFIPGPDPAALSADGADWRWGQSTVGRLGDLVLDVLKRAVWLAALRAPERDVIIHEREHAHRILRAVRAERATLDDFWWSRKHTLPHRGTEVAATPAELTALRTALATMVPLWDGETEAQQGSTRERLYDQALRFATCLAAARDALVAIAHAPRSRVDPAGAERDRLRALVHVLLPSDQPRAVLRQMLRLEVVQVAFTGATDQVEQEVELVQLSCRDDRLITGIQLHHFGAFYRDSWRANDWLRGRLDAAEQLVQMLLAPERLRQRCLTAAAALQELRRVAVGPADAPRHAELDQAWQEQERHLAAELAVLDGNAPLPRTFPQCAARIAHRLRMAVLDAELEALAAAVEEEDDPLPDSRAWAARVRRSIPVADGAPRPSCRELDDLLDGSKTIGQQRIRAEAVGGSDTFARTVTHAGANLGSLLGSLPVPKPIGSLLSTLRGYTLLVWALVSRLTSGSNVGRHTTALTVGVGGALVGLSLVVPGLPLAVPLVGAVLLLGAGAAAALSDRDSRRSSLGRRLVIAAALALLAVAGVVAQWVGEQEDIGGALLSTLGRVIAVAAVVLLGTFLARSRRRRPTPDR